MSHSEGGFYLFPRFENRREISAERGIEDGQTFADCLLEETGVALLPGYCFGRPDRELSARIALVDFDGGPALEAAEHEAVNAAFLERRCSRVTTAIDLMADWVRG